MQQSPSRRPDLFGETPRDVARYAAAVGTPVHLRHQARGVLVWAGVMAVATVALAVAGRPMPAWEVAGMVAGLAAWMWVQDVYTAGQHGRRLPGLWLARSVLLVLLVALSAGVALLVVALLGGPQVIR